MTTKTRNPAGQGQGFGDYRGVIQQPQENHEAFSHNCQDNFEEVGRLILDGLAKVPKNLTEAALHYAAHGWPVFPVDIKKRPLTAHGHKDATTDPAKIRAMFKNPRAAGVAIPTGTITRLVVLDRDRKNGVDGVATCKALEADLGTLPETLRQRTGSGGDQLCYRYPEGVTIKNSAGGLGPGLDVRSVGGYIVVPPSRNEAGDYVWLNDLDPAELPEAWVDFLKERPRPEAEPKPEPKQNTGPSSTTPYGLRALEAERQAVASETEGGRNHRLNLAAFAIGQLVGGEEIDEGEARQALMRAALACGLGEAEAVKTIASGLTAGMASPRNANSAAAGMFEDASGEAGQEEAAQAVSVWDSPVDIAAMLATKPKPMPWLVTERIPFGRGGGLAALGGTGKTTLLKALAVGCVTGRLPMEGWEVERTGKVVLVLTEDTQAEFHEDLHRLCYNMTPHERELIVQNLIVYPLAGKDTRLLTKSPRGVVEKSPLYHALVAKVQAIGGAVLVGLDPALGITEGDEMNQADQRALGRAVDDLGVTVGATCILLAHSTKALSNAKELGSHSSRGGGALTDALRFEITMRGMTAEEATAHGIEDLEERLHLVQVAITKGNRIPPSAKVPVWLRYDSGTLVSAGLVEPEKKTRAGGTKLPKSAALALEAIKEATMERGQIDDATGRPYVAMDDIRTIHKDLYTQRNPANGDRAERKALQDGTSKLAELGWIKSDGMTVSFSGPGAEAHIQNILEAMAERQRNFGTERNFSEQSSGKGTLKSGTERNPPLYIGGSGSAKFRGDFDQEDETRPEQSETPSSLERKIDPLAHGLWSEGVIHVREDCAGHPQLCSGCVHHLDGACGQTAPF